MSVCDLTMSFDCAGSRRKNTSLAISSSSIFRPKIRSISRSKSDGRWYSQYKKHLFGLSGHNAGSFTATAFIVKFAGPGGVSIGNPAAASIRLLASIVAWAASLSTCASTTCCGVNKYSPLHEFRYPQPTQLSMRDERKCIDA